jgi:hypothetical protein
LHLGVRFGADHDLVGGRQDASVGSEGLDDPGPDRLELLLHGAVVAGFLGQQAAQVLGPLPDAGKDRFVQQGLGRSEVVADRRQADPCGGGDVTRRGAGVPLVRQAFSGALQERFAVAHGASVA